MAPVTELRVRVDWQDAPEVTSPELRSTWCRLEIWVGESCVTMNERHGGAVRRGIDVSLYPLALWLAENWWSIRFEPASHDGASWESAGDVSWDRRHNLRFAGDGMAWPDLTIACDDRTAELSWSPWTNVGGRTAFLASGRSIVPMDSLNEVLVQNVVVAALDRLAEHDLRATPLHEAWTAVTEADAGEVEFCRVAARLGQDPYALGEGSTALILETAERIPGEVWDDFFATVSVGELASGARWLTRGAEALEQLATGKSKVSLELNLQKEIGPPWRRGYAAATALRSDLNVEPHERLELRDLVPVRTLEPGRPRAADGLAISNYQGCRVGTAAGLSEGARRFAQARGLGLSVLRPHQHLHVLNASGTDAQRASRAFAAELLAPAVGVADMLAAVGHSGDTAIEAVARQYGVSPLVVRYQVRNQLA